MHDLHESLRLYDASLTVLSQEAEAIDREDEDLLCALSKKRAALMEEAWNKRAGCSAALLRERLERIDAAQIKLQNKVRMQVDSLRISLQYSHKQGNRLAGYGNAVKFRQNALLVSREG
ncbi:hypothetical protein FACS1894206_03880 [Deltaproteobacteria bacterium]|nr:hypothetical protein FACS1894206_03880 [Deltaproteobacteria bacterium]